MYYIVDTDKTFDQAAADLEDIAVHLAATLRGKGVAFAEECRNYGARSFITTFY